MADQHSPGFLSRLREGLAHALAGDMLEKKAGKQPIDAHMIAAVTGQVRPTISGAEPDGWMGPRQPLLPQAPADVKGRQWDFPVGVNMQYTPRGAEVTSFGQMRALADGYDLLRLAIETRKDQLAKMKWGVQPKDQTKKADRRCDEIEAFLLMPDVEHNWDDWIRALVEEMLVTDSATVYPQLTRAGKPYKLELLDGATIHRVIDPSGRTPEPPDVAYQQVLKGVVAADYHRDELIYAPRNMRVSKLYGYSAVEQVIMTVNIAIRRQLYQLQFYTDGSVPDLILEVPDTWQPDQVKAFTEWWEQKLSGNTAARRSPMFVPKGVKPINVKEGALKDDYDEWLARIICYAFSLSPTAFVKQTNRATAESAQEAALTEGLVPLMGWIRNLVNRIIWKYWGYTDLTFAWIEEEALDPEAQASINNTKVRNATKTINEVRADDGMDPIEGGDEPLIYTAAGAVLLRDILNPPEPVATPALGADGKPVAPNAPADGPKPPEEQKPAEPATKLAKARARKTLTPINRDRKLIRSKRNAMTKIVKKFLDDRMPDMVQQIVKGIDKVSKVDQNELDAIIASLDFEGWAVLSGDVDGVLAAAGIDGGVQALMQVGIGDESITEQVNERAVEYAKDRSAEMVGKKWVDGELVDNPNAEFAITESTRDLLRSTISQAIEERWGIDDLANAIAEDNAFSEQRAELIAHTEVARADMQGSMAGYRESGVVEKKVWLLSNDHDVDDECLIGETPVIASGVRRTFSRVYCGEIVNVHLSNGRKLSGTPNHPVLTNAGWKALHELCEGDYLISGEIIKAMSLIANDFDQVETALQNIVGSIDGRTATSPTSAGDFHGDGIGSKIHRVTTDCSLWPANKATRLKQSIKSALSFRIAFSAFFTRARDGFMGAPDLIRFIFWRCATPPFLAGIAKGAQRIALPSQSGCDSAARNAGAFRNLVSGKLIDKIQLGQHRGWDISRAHSVVMITRSKQTVPVYNLTTRNGIYLACDIVTSNCDDSADEGEIPLDDDFAGGDAPPAHPGCLCSIAAIVYEDTGNASDESDSEKAAASGEMRKMRRQFRELRKVIAAPPTPPVIHVHPAPAPEVNVNVQPAEVNVHTSPVNVDLTVERGAVSKTITTSRNDKGELVANVLEKTE